ncbi:MAG: hypothetical protein E7515_07650 [Ruminococcaceae bacterium]|nr:hypothetical protein [Oscillospiraceae bacterium]
MKKKVFIAIGVVIAVAITLTVVFFPFIKTRLYLKDRIKGHVEILINGTQYSIDSLKYTTPTDKEETELSIENGEFSIKGGEYGEYEFSFSIDNDIIRNHFDNISFNALPKTVLSFVYLNSNWWNITDMFFTIDIREKDGEPIVNLSVEYDESSETYQKNETETTEKNYILSNENSVFELTFGL